MIIKNLLLVLSSLIVLSASSAMADTIKLTPEELSLETVLPVFEYPAVVKNRRVPIKGRFELGLMAGFILTEPLYTNTGFALSGTYNFTEKHGVNLFGLFVSSGLSGNGERLKAGEGFGRKFDPSLAPFLENIILANYVYTAYYGKMSLSKKLVVNLSLSGLAGLGMVGYEDSQYLAMQLGASQRFFFNKHWGINFDIRFLGHQGPDPTSKDLSANGGITTKQSSDVFDEAFFLKTTLAAGLVVLF